MSSSANNPGNSAQAPQDQPGLVASHAEYVKGAVESAIGSTIGSHAWSSSGEQDKAHAVASMKAAGATRDAGEQGYGKVEALAGKAVGCEGMRKEGEQSARDKAQ